MYQQESSRRSPREDSGVDGLEVASASYEQESRSLVGVPHHPDSRTRGGRTRAGPMSAHREAEAVTERKKGKGKRRREPRERGEARPSGENRVNMTVSDKAGHDRL